MGEQLAMWSSALLMILSPSVLILNFAREDQCLPSLHLCCSALDAAGHHARTCDISVTAAVLQKTAAVLV